jgi:protein SCO1/2
MSPILRRASLALTLALATACGRAHAPAPATGAAALPERAEASDFSVYELAKPWKDQDGRERTLASLGGKVRVLAMVYTHCTHTCPQIIVDFKQLEARLTTAERADAGFVLVSLDPARDTPARLREFATETRLDTSRWTLLTGSDESVREIAALLGIRYRAEAAGEISHSNAYLVLDREGRIVHRQDGLGGDPAETLAAIRSAASASTTE